MRAFSFIPVLAVLVTAVAGVPTTGQVPPTKRNSIEYPARDVYGLTNAELLRRGLPLNGPVIRRGAFMWLRLTMFSPPNLGFFSHSPRLTRSPR